MGNLPVNGIENTASAPHILIYDNTFAIQFYSLLKITVKHMYICHAFAVVISHTVSWVSSKKFLLKNCN